MAAEIGEFLISMPFDSLPPILSLTPRWLFSAILTKNLTMSRVSRSVSIHNPAYHNVAICKSMYDFLFNFNSNHEAKCHRLEDTALWKHVT